MSNKNLSTVATEVIAACGITATNVINSYRYGGERLVGFVDERFASAVNRGAAALRADLRSNLIGTQQRVTGYYVKGIQLGTDRAQSVVGVAVDLATKGVSLVAEGAVRLDRAANANALDTLNRVVRPAAEVVSRVAERLEEGSSALVRRVAGKPVPAKALATRQLDARTRKAAAARKRITKTATREVSQAVADTATSASNAARRVARQANTTTKRVNKAVAETATQTSNAARRVARKARTVAAQA
jgi:hypothetical protein